MRLADAQAAIAAVIAHAAATDAKPLGIVVLDSGAHLVASVRQDGASLFRIDIARAKAAGALGMGADSRELAGRATVNPVFFNSIVVASGGAMALSAGGVLIRDTSGGISGAIGVSGDASDIDETCAQAGVAALEQGAL